MAGEQQQEHHGHDFVGADLSAVPLDANDLGDQPFAALPANGFEVPFDVALHRKDVRHRAEKSERAGEAGKGAGPGNEFRPVGQRAAREARKSPTAAACAHSARPGRPGFLLQTVRRRVRHRGPEYAAPSRAQRGGEKPRPRYRATACDRARPWTACWLASVRTMPGIHHRCPATAPSSLRMVKVSVSFST